MGSADISPSSPLGLALSSLPSTPDLSISFSLQQAVSPSHAEREEAFGGGVGLDELVGGAGGGGGCGRPPAVVLDMVGSAGGARRTSLSSVVEDGPGGGVGGVMLSEGEERRERDESLSDDDTDGSRRAETADRQQLNSSDGLSAEDRQRRAERKMRKKERDSHVWFADISLIEQTLAALRLRTRDKNKAGKLTLHQQPTDLGGSGGIDEGDEDMDELEDEEDQPRLLRAKSIEEKAPMPIIATDASTSPAGAQQEKKEEHKERDQEGEGHTKEEKEPAMHDEDGTSPMFPAVVSPPSSTSPPPASSPSSSDAMSSAMQSLLNISLSSPSSSSSLPAEFVDTFFERVQRDMYNLAKQKREDEILKKLKDEEDRLEAQHTDTAAEAVSDLSSWSCPTCTYNNLPLTTRCDMCDTLSPLPPPPTSSSPLLYFEATVLSLGDKACLGIGLCQSGYSSHMMPGWRQGSWGFHGDNGAVYRADQSGKEYAEKWNVGDVVGCGLRLSQRELFFTLNGRDLGVAFTDVPIADYYACVGLHSKGEAMTINFGQQPFLYTDLPSCFVPRPDLTLRSPAATVLAEIDTATFLTLTSLTDGCSLVQSSGLADWPWQDTAGTQSLVRLLRSDRRQVHTTTTPRLRLRSCRVHHHVAARLGRSRLRPALR